MKSFVNSGDADDADRTLMRALKGADGADIVLRTLKNAGGR